MDWPASGPLISLLISLGRVLHRPERILHRGAASMAPAPAVVLLGRGAASLNMWAESFVARGNSAAKRLSWPAMQRSLPLSAGFLRVRTKGNPF